MREMDFKPYLLGTISEADRVAIEHQVITDDHTYEAVLLAEDDLIEAYIRHQLSAVEQTQFEQFFLADPERQKRLRLAQTLQRYATQNLSAAVKNAAASNASESWWTGFRRPLWQWALAGCLLVALLLGLRELLTSKEPQMIAQSSPTPTLAPALATGTEIQTLELSPGQVRAAGVTDSLVTLTPNTETLRLKLWLENSSYSNYEAVLIPDGEAEKKVPGQWQPQSAPEGKFVLVTIPVQMLDRGGHTLKLGGISNDGTVPAEVYNFHIRQ